MIISLTCLRVSVSMSQHLLLSATSVYLFVCVCLRASLSEHTPNLWICVPLNSSPCHSVCPLFHKPVFLLSGIRWHIIFPYLSVYLPPFLSFIQLVFLFCPGIPAIRVHSLQGLDAICRMISELMLHFCTIPTSNCLVKTGFPVFFSCQKSQGMALIGGWEKLRFYISINLSASTLHWWKNCLLY